MPVKVAYMSMVSSRFFANKSTPPKSDAAEVKVCDQPDQDVLFAHAMVDKTGVFTDVSEELLHLTGLKRTMLKGASLGKILSHSSAVIARHLLTTIHQGQPFQTTEITLIRKDQQPIAMELVMNLFIQDGQDHFFCIFRNLDPGRRMMAELQTLKDHYQLLAEHTSYVQILLDKDLKSLYISPSCKTLSGYTPGEARIRNLFSLVHPDDFSLFWDQLTFDNEKTEEQFRFRFRHRDGHFIPVECLLCKVPDAFGQPDFFVLNLHDITRQKSYEQELIRAQKEAESSHRMKNNFLTSITHELRTPLNAIIGFARILDQKNELPDNHRFSHYIESSGLELLGLIDNLLEYARIENNETTSVHNPVKLEEFFRDLAPVVRGDLKKFNKENLELIAQWEVDPMLPEIYSNRNVLQNIFINLLDNAIKFTRQGYIRYGCRPYGIRNYLFFVEDSGIGIPVNCKDLIFEKFTQLDQSLSREFGGTGLGLTVTRKFVDLLGGDIWVMSEEGKGSSFFFTIPVGFPEPL